MARRLISLIFIKQTRYMRICSRRNTTTERIVDVGMDVLGEEGVAGGEDETSARTGITNRIWYSDGGAALSKKGSVMATRTREIRTAITPLLRRGSTRLASSAANKSRSRPRKTNQAPQKKQRY